MSTKRAAPVRPIASGPWAFTDRLDRRLARLVGDARKHQQRLEAVEDLPAVAEELSGRARASGLAVVLPEALALTVVAAERLIGQSWEVSGDELVWDLRPRDNQIACAAVLARGDVAELDTGEGKTLCAAMAAACWALVGRAHVVTANDYLARRDLEWMGPLIESLGFEVGGVDHQTAQQHRQEAYQADVTYVSIKEVGADYLRDTLTSERAALLLPALETAILDEIDFILVDEARIPLILAEQIDLSENLCHQFNEAVEGLVAEQEGVKVELFRELDEVAAQPGWTERTRRFEENFRLAKLMLADPLDPRLDKRFSEAIDAGDGGVVRRVRNLTLRFEKVKRKEELLEELLFTVDRKHQAVQLTENGLDRLQRLFGDLFDEPSEDPEEIEAHRNRLRAVHNLIAAHVLYRRDHEYIIDDGKVVLVDQSTGRPSFDRHLQHGLHRALEAKEGLYPALDHRTAAEITFPGLFQLYHRFCGTSGTCLELGRELKKAHKKEVVRVPPYRPRIRVDFDDALFRTKEEKAEALVAEVRLARRLRQPVLIGTSSVEQSEWVSTRLAEAELPHQVLNARHHEKEARIIARAGEPATITVATSMAGRGTDIRPPADLPQQIVAAAADWASDQIAAGAPAGVRLELFSDLELELTLEALENKGLSPRIFRRRKRSTLVDVGEDPPSTGFSLGLGLRIIGFQRFGASRLDRQMRGRTGRQGSPGSTRFYLALDDETVLIHADRARLAELRRRSRPLLDPLSGHEVRSGRQLIEEVKRAWFTWESIIERQRERLNKLDAVDQAQRSHYDSERRALLFAEDAVVTKLADETIRRAARELSEEIATGADYLDPELEPILDDMTQVLFERRGLLQSLLSAAESPKTEKVSEALAGALDRLYDVARQAHGEAMTQVERTVLLDSLTEVWRNLSAERPELRQQAELYAYANRQPADVYRLLIGQAYHQALAAAARAAASVLVAFPLPRELKTPRTGVPVEDPAILALIDV